MLYLISQPKPDTIFSVYISPAVPCVAILSPCWKMAD